MTIEIFRVGGCVRDLLLRKEGLDIPEGDRDWVVTGATPEDMVSKGYLPVGADFPVFLHPETHEEYALARTERKTAAGYHGFQFYAAPDVTLTDDLRRRDLTINAMAQSADGTIIDPYGGQKDLKARLLRHVSSAFAEDPVRILRIARFAAKLPGFTVAPETMVLLRKMVACGEADALVAERVWAEFKKGLMSADPAAMIAVLKACGYWERAFPEVPASGNEIRALTRATKAGFPLTVRAVLLFETAGEDESAVRRRFKALRAPADVTELALLQHPKPWPTSWKKAMCCGVRPVLKRFWRRQRQGTRTLIPRNSEKPQRFGARLTPVVLPAKRSAKVSPLKLPRALLPHAARLLCSHSLRECAQ